MELLVTRPDHDDATYWLCEWFLPILTECHSKGIKYVDLLGDKANKSRVKSALKKAKARLVVFNGHGTRDSILGFKNETLINDKESIALLKDKVVYAIACDSAAKLGPECVKKGTCAYIGYKLPFMILSNPNKGFKPLEDELIKPVLEASNEVVRTLLKGKSAGEAYSRSQFKFDHYIQKYERDCAPIEAQNLLPVLYWNKMAQTLIGNKEACAK